MSTWNSCLGPFPLARHRQRGLALVVALIALAAMSLTAIWLVRLVDLNVATASNLAFRESAGLSAGIWSEEARHWLLTQYADNPANTENPDAKLEVSQPGKGYYALRQEGSDQPCGSASFDGVDFTGTCAPQTMSGEVAWQNADGSKEKGDIEAFCQTDAQMTNGARACWVIHRLCETEGPTPGDTSPSRDDQRCADGPGGNGKQVAASQQSSLDAYDENHYRQPASSASGNGQAMPPLVYRITVRMSGPRRNAAYFQTFILL